MRILGLSVALLAAVNAAPLSARPAPPAAGKASFSGMLVSADTGKPLSDATITVNQASGKTDKAGNFSIALPMGKLFMVVIQHDGFYEARYAFTRAEIAERGAAKVSLVERHADRRLLVFGGDVMTGRRYETPPSGERQLVHAETREADTRALLEVMAPELRAADLASVNLEITLSARKLEAFSPKSIVFYSDPEIVKTLKWAGVDYAAQGNNHVYDYLEPGLADTLAAVEAVQLGHSGAGMDVPSAVAPWRTTITGKPWSFLSFVGWKGTVTPNQVADIGKGGAALGDEDTIVTAVKAEAKAGRAVVMQYHGSEEYSPRPTDISERRMRAAIDAGADLVVGHHPHVLQGLELYHGKLIAHSMGNFLFDQTFPETQATMLLKVWMDGDRFARAEIVPIDERDYRPVPAVAGMRAAVLQRMRALSGEFGLRIAEMGGHGVILPDSAPERPAAARAVSLAAPVGVTAVPLTADLASAGWPVRATDAAGHDLGFGRSLLWRGDFESQEGFGAIDRTWTIARGSMAFDATPRHGDTALAVTPADGVDSVTFGPKVALRNVAWSPMTVTGAIRGGGDVLTVEYQYRYKGAAGDASWQRAGTATVDGADWTAFSFDIPQPDTAPDTMRLRYVVRGADGKVKPFALDDLDVVEWEGSNVDEDRVRGLRSYVRLPADAPSRQISLTINDWAQPPAKH